MNITRHSPKRKTENLKNKSIFHSKKINRNRMSISLRRKILITCTTKEIADILTRWNRIIVNNNNNDVTNDSMHTHIDSSIDTNNDKLTFSYVLSNRKTLDMKHFPGRSKTQKYVRHRNGASLPQVITQAGERRKYRTSVWQKRQQAFWSRPNSIWRDPWRRF